MKISLNKPASGYNLAAIVENFTRLEEEFQNKVLYRNNPTGEPNTLETDLDVNGKRLYNVGELTVGGVNLSSINSALIWRGAWSSATAYAKSDAVYYNGSSYIAIAANVNSAPPSADWNTLAAQGASGAGTGDVIGPASSMYGNLPVFDSGTGKLLRDSGITVHTGGAVEQLLEATTASAARTALVAAESGVNSSITSLTGLTLPVGLVPNVQGTFKNLQASSTGLNANISVSADEIVLENTGNSYQVVRGVSLTVSAAASGANGLDTGTLATSTWYSLWVIWNGTTTAGLLSLSSTAPTMPAGYTHKARVGWVRTDGTANKYPLAFKQAGRRVQYVVGASGNLTALPLMASGVLGTYVGSSSNTLAAVSVSPSVPPTASQIKVHVSTANTTTYMFVAPNANYNGGYPSATNVPLYVNAVNTGGVLDANTVEMLLESTSIYVVSNGASCYLACVGWEDNL